ncbi:aldose 1-epimerase [Polaribacter pacificus]|uniref:Aldose 1-epimerase n=1 Tax=Polaribacter pacificus TaxID=1775173 RepID=A0A917HS57_9FLAO|nr:aldose epimerase family protein [Polaribacter pacificus]GGG88434.1 aldose 1-epimerase [Polaribacter pacificus]
MNANTQQPNISKTVFGVTPDGIVVDQYTLSNAKGMQLSIITFGGIITSLKAPNKNQEYQDIVLGYPNLEPYLANPTYFGAIIGRYGNRIANGTFKLKGKTYSLATNNGKNHLHGGTKGFDKVVWTASPATTDTTVSLTLNYISKDLEEGYPGTLNTQVVYTLSDDNTLTVDYTATTDKSTVVNLTQHSYFNLSGDFSNTILDHQLSINADAYLPVDGGLIPTGTLASVNNTPFDFRTAKTIGRDINTKDLQLERGLGYDHCWVLNDQNQGQRLAATAYHPESGRVLEVFTDQPGIQLYTGNFLDGTLPNKQGGNYEHRTGFCLETQHYPDSPNQQSFPTTVLNPGETYHTQTRFKFSTK